MTAFTLKAVAIIAMVIDHIDKIFGIHFGGLFLLENIAASNLSHCLNCVGRLTFPIMAFFIAEGCKKTKNIHKYAARLLIFALISEPIFNLAFDIYNSVYTLKSFEKYTLFSFTGQNVIFTLFFGCIAILIFEYLKDKKVLGYSCVVILGLLAEILRTEYGTLGVLLIFVAYSSKTAKIRFVSMSTILFILYIIYVPWNNGLMWLEPHGDLWRYMTPCLFSISAVVLLYFYNGKRGYNCKYLFYAFYPLHLLILVIIRELIFR